MAAKKTPTSSASASSLITDRIASLADWRGATLQRVREIITKADPAVVEEWKWDGPVWSCDGIICTGEVYKKAVKLTFAQGASLPDPSGLFTSSLEGKVRRAVDIQEGQPVDAKALTALVRAAIAFNRGEEGGSTTAVEKPATAKTAKPAPPKRDVKTTAEAGAKAGPKLLSGGNPQIAKADGDEAVQAYIAAIPEGWKREVGQALDALIVRSVPAPLKNKLRKAVKWNSPFYGIDGQGWFVSFHVFTNYVKVTFFVGASLMHGPTGGSGKDARWIDIHEDDLNEKQLSGWVKQAATIPGWLGK